MRKLFLAKPDLTFFEQYNDMMEEWVGSHTQIAPWFFAATSSYFVIDENGKLIGAASLRHYLTVEGYQTWGHIGYGVRPGERRKGYAVQMLKMMLELAQEKKIYKVLIGVHDSNIGSWKTVEKCGGVLENTVLVSNDEEPIRRYWIDNTVR